MSDMAKTKPMRRKTTKREKKEWVAAYIFIAPLVIGIFVFYIYPFIQNFWFSFNDVNRFNISTFTGLENYKALIKDKELYRTLGNTIKYVIITVPVGICLSILIATLLNAKIRGTSIYRTIYFLPSVTMSVAIALVWKWMYNGEFGILNNILGAFGIEGQNWLSNPKTALYMVMVVGIWMSVGYNMIILLAGMQGISKSYYEAAAIDGAGPVKRFFKITIPMLTPTIFFVMITSIIGGFQVFDTIYMMIGKTSLAYESTQTLVMMFYRYAFDYGQKGYAAAISIVIFAIIMLITIFQFVMQKKWVNYD
ncbi:MAG: sugar ABC transporter permease [Anaerocolumna aminovalerica]|jgi:multiple sugar transport system permease protein|uniref:carbohydrate ABC transporter permease n=1 Tax=Anaerocolumna aminovalerica TaxID=1527 RepID=UPI000BE2D6F3|nr:sugar ABC transporter permease [Anaerocolumna aminovalerica]MBU5333061.1 sugar ABC transporter permease [Anaerocolumna aminovalerica]MDU6264608.1 sugar ABC transporter permease [Anaerocolumna aminovalerica]